MSAFDLYKMTVEVVDLIYHTFNTCSENCPEVSM